MNQPLANFQSTALQTTAKRWGEMDQGSDNAQDKMPSFIQYVDLTTTESNEQFTK